MEEEVTGRGVKLGGEGAGEVDYKAKAGTAWSHSYLNQKPWHPLSYPNQRRKWIAEQTHANRARRQEEVSREFAQEQEFFRQTSLFNKKDKDKVEMMKAVSFMYVRPPGYNAESAKAAELADEDKSNAPSSSHSQQPDTGVHKDQPSKETKARPKDIYGRSLPTEQEFEVLKNAPRLDTGVAARSKPFGVEIRNVRCVRCGTYGHQSGDRECPMKDVIMPNDESRLKRDDPLNTILAQTDVSEPLKWELKQKPGMSPPRGGFRPDDPNQLIVADHDEIFDEYGGFLTGGDIPILLSNFSPDKPKKKRRRRHGSKSKSKHKQHSSPESEYELEPDKRAMRSKSKHKQHRFSHSKSDSEPDKRTKRSKSKHKQRSSSESESESEPDKRSKRSKRKHKQHSSSESESESEPDMRTKRLKSKHNHHSSSELESELEPNKRSNRLKCKHKQHSSSESESESEHNKRTKRSKSKHKKHYSSDSDEAERRSRRSKGKHKSRRMSDSSPSSSEDDGRCYSSRSSKKREHVHLERVTDRSKSIEARQKKCKDGNGKHVTAHTDTSESDSHSRRRQQRQHHHHHRRHH